MAGGIETAVRANKNVVTKDYLSAVQDDQIVISVEVISDDDIVAVIAEEIGLYPGIFTSESDESVESSLLFLEIVVGYAVVLSAELFCGYSFSSERAVVSVVELPCLLFFFSVMSDLFYELVSIVIPAIKNINAITTDGKIIPTINCSTASLRIGEKSF